MSGKTIQRRSKTSLGLSLAGALVALLTMAFAAEAIEIRARCDYRGGARERTKVSVDVKNATVSGDYSANLNDVYGATERITLPNDEAEFDFDSNPKNIARGATPIPADLGSVGFVEVSVTGPGVETSFSVPCPGEVRVP